MTAMHPFATAAILALCAAGSSHVTQAAEPTGALTLACQGTVIDKTDPSSEVAKPEPVSMGSHDRLMREVSALNFAAQITYLLLLLWVLRRGTCMQP